MNTLLIILGICAFAANSISIRTFQLKCERQNSDTYLFQSLFCLVAAAAYSVSGGFVFELSVSQTLSAALFGLFFAMAVLFSAECFICGPMSLTSVIVNSSVVIPVLYSCIVLKENITLTQISGCILLILTFFLSTFQKGKAAGKGVSSKWVFLVLIAFASNGITAIIQKLYKITAPNSDGNMFMSFAYLTAAVVLLISFAVKKKEVKAAKAVSRNALPMAIALVFIAGLGSFIGNGILMNLSTKVSAALLYPFVNGGLCVTVSAFSIIIFREKLDFKKSITILAGLSAIIVLNL